jgi:hypothetical protein
MHAHKENIVARDLPGGKRICIINMRAQHITFNKAIKQLSLMALLKVICCQSH